MYSLPLRRCIGIATLATTMALGACTTTGGGRAAAAGGGETAAQAATFRYLFANNASALKGDSAAYCIGMGGAQGASAPGRDLMAALSDVRPAVRPISACRSDARVVDASGRPALIFNLETVECDGTSCLFRGGYREGNVSASSATYRARLVDGNWQVTQEGPMAIS